MSLNGVTVHSDGVNISLYEGEKIFYSCEGVSFDYESGGGYPGSGETFYSKSGTLILTNLRIAYLAIPPQQLLKNIDIPLSFFHDGRFIQPWLGCNYYEGILQPVANGGFRKPGRTKFSFHKGGGATFTHMLEELRQKIQDLGEIPQHLEQLPAYIAPPDIDENQDEEDNEPFVGSNLETPNVAITTTANLNNHPSPISIPVDAPPAYDTVEVRK